MSTFQPCFSESSLAFLSAGDGPGSQQVVWEVPVQPDPKHGTQPLRIAANVVGGGDDERTLSLEEKLQRERLRQLSTGITGYQVVGSFVYFVQHGSLYRSLLQPGRARDVASGEAQLVVDNTKLRVAAGQQSASPVSIGPDPAACADKPILNPKVSPDGAFVAFVWGGGLHIAPLPGPAAAGDVSSLRAYRISPLPEAGAGRTSGGVSPASAAAADVTYGLADYLSEEEFARMEGFWWSPDSRSICYQRTDASAVPVVTLCGRVPLPAASPRGAPAADAASPAPATLSKTADGAAALPDPRSMPSRPHEEQHKYPYAGETNPSIALFVADLSPLLRVLTPPAGAAAAAVDAAATTGPAPDAAEAAAASVAARAQELQLGANSDVYVPRVRWLPDSGGLLVQVLNRRQDCLDLVHYACAAGEGGEGQLLIRERSVEGWLNVSDCCTPLPAPAGCLTQHLLWASERTGHRHLYLYAFVASAAPKAMRSPPRGAGAGAVSRYDGPDPAAPLAPPRGTGSAAGGSAGANEAGERWTYIEPALTGGGTAVEVRAVTAGRWAVEDVLSVVAADGHAAETAAGSSAAGASGAGTETGGLVPAGRHAVVLFHATAQGPTEKHLYAAPVYAWEPRPVQPAAAGTDGLLAQSLGITAAMVSGATLPAAVLPSRLPALWFDRDSSAAAIAARVVAAREVACFTEHARFCQFGILRLTQGPGWHTCVLSADQRYLADELSCAYSPEPALQLCSIDKESLLAATACSSRGTASAALAGTLPSPTYFAAGSAESAAAKRLLQGPPVSARPPITDNGDGHRSESCTSPFTSCFSGTAPSSAPRGSAAAPTRGEARFCCGSASDLLGSLFAPCTDASASTSSGAASARAPSGAGAACAPSPCTGPREHMTSQLVAFEGSGVYHCCGAAPQVAAVRSPLVRCLGVPAGCLPHPYAPTAAYVQAASTLLGWEVLPLLAALDNGSKQAVAGDAALPPSGGSRGSQTTDGSSSMSVGSLFEADTYTSLPGKIISLLSSPFAAADPAKTVPTDGSAVGSGSSSADAGAAADDFRWSQGQLSALLFPAGLLPAGQPLEEAKATRVALRRGMPVPPQQCYDAAPLGSHSLPRPIFLALRTAAEWQTFEAAQPTSDRLAGACSGCRLSLPDDGGLMYAALTLPAPAEMLASAAGRSSASTAVQSASSVSAPAGNTASWAGAAAPVSASDNLFGPAVRDTRSPPAWAPLPTVLYVYGGPAAQIVTHSSALLKGRNSHNGALCAEGFAVVMVDNRGSTRRGCAFERPILRRLGEVEIQDQLAALQQLVAAGVVEPSQVGVHGWSYGGYMTLRLLAHEQVRPGRDVTDKATEPPHLPAAPLQLPFRAGVAGAPVTSWLLYDTAYTERYQSLPAEQPLAYAACDVKEHVRGLVGRRFLVIHGWMDENVHAVHSEELQRRIEVEGPALVGRAAGRSFSLGHEFVFLPGERHAVRGALRQWVQQATVAFLCQHVMGKPVL